MDPLVSIPRDALTALLKAAGSPMTAEEYLASLYVSVEDDPFRKYKGRQTAAVWSKYFLLGATIISGVICAMDIDFEGVLITLMLAGFTYFESRAHAGFRDHNPETPTIGFYNQSAFAAFIFIYCIYHAFKPVEIPTEYREYMDPDMSNMVHTFTIVTYLALAIVGGASQFWLAWYYRTARIKETA